jgi:protein NrfC
MKDDTSKTSGNDPDRVTRRSFLQRSRNAAVGTVVAGSLPSIIWLNDAVAAIPASGGYLLADTRKCQGCMTCMLACSLVHEGKENLSLARIQVIQNSFAKFPNDTNLALCRQCVEPACLEACPTGALFIDHEHDNVRTIDAEKCIGCKKCIQACPYAPARPIWNFEDMHAQKCDLCADTPFWKEQGGPDGKQACVELCPVAALAFTRTIPAQVGDRGYNINLRREGWENLGFSIDSEYIASDRTTPYRLPYAGRYKWPSDTNHEESDGKEAKK